MDLVGERSYERFSHADHVQVFNAMANLLRGAFTDRPRIIHIPCCFLVVTDAKEPQESARVLLHRLSHLVVRDAPRPSLYQRTPDIVLVHICNEVLGIIDGEFRERGVVEIWIACPEADEIFRRGDFVAEILD